jgi:hypothetical protein
MSLGAQKGFTASSRADEYCHNGRMALAHQHPAAGSGSKKAIMAPSGGPLKVGGLQGKSPQGPGSVPFGGSNGLVCLDTSA